MTLLIYTSGSALSNLTPSDTGTASAGTGGVAARYDHVHNVGATSSMRRLAIIEVGSEVASIAFNGGLGAYKFFVVKITWNCNSAGNTKCLYMNLNTDTGNNYTVSYLDNATSTEVNPDNKIKVGKAYEGGAGYMSSAEITISNITSMRKTSVGIYNGFHGPLTGMHGALYNITTALNTITFVNESGVNFRVGTTAILYGCN